MNWQLEVYQWLVPIIAIYFILRTLRQYRSKKYSPRNTVIWIVFWIGIMLLAMLPDQIPNSIARGLGFKDQINAIIFVCLAVLFIMVFFLSAAVNRIEDKMTTLVRTIALEAALKEKSSIATINTKINHNGNTRKVKRKAKRRAKKST